MKLAWIFGILIISILLVSGGCGKKEATPVTGEIVKEVLEDLSVSEAVEELNKQGFTLGEEKDAFPQIFAADDGTKLDVNGVEVDIYYFGEGKETIKENFKKVLIASKQAFETRGLIFIVHSKDTAFGDEIKEALN